MTNTQNRYYVQPDPKHGRWLVIDRAQTHCLWVHSGWNSPAEAAQEAARLNGRQATR